MNRSKYLSLLLAVVLVMTSFAFPVTVKAEAELNFSGLNMQQQYYLRLIGSFSRADYYETDVLASVTAAQAIYEGGWGSYSLPIGGNNIFGIKAYNTWDGMVYDQTTSLLYNSYSDFLLGLGQLKSDDTSAWRAHSSWRESVKVHSDLFLYSGDQYAAVVGEKDYKTALIEIVNGGYCDGDYAEQATKILERYGLDYYDDITPDEDGIVALTADQERLRLDIGESYSLGVTYYPSDKTPSSILWESDDESIATVDQNGNITAVSHGTAFITATLANGREACCIVYVDCNATVMDKNIEIRSTPSESSDTLGRVYRGCALKLISDEIIQGTDGNEFVRVYARDRDGELEEGYALAEYIYANERNVSSITVVKDDITLVPEQQYEIVAAIASIDAEDADLAWTSSNESVATVDDNGIVTAVAKGEAVITAAAAGGAKTEIKVTVASKAKEYTGIITASGKLRIRSEADWDSTSLGSIEFLSQIKVHGEPDGYWYNVTGTTTSGKTVTGYAFCTYVQLVGENESVKYGTATSGVSVYKNADASSSKLGALKDGCSIAVLSTDSEGWSYVIGTSASGDTIYGYSKLDGSAEIPPDVGTVTPPVTNPVPGGDVGGGSDLAGAWYGIANVDSYLNIRASASTSSEVIGKISGGERVTVVSEADGWCKVIYDGIEGYSSSDYIIDLYVGKVINIDDNLNVREAPTTSAEIVGKLQNDDEVTIIGEVSGGWYQIENDDLEGYCSADYIQVVSKLFVNTSSANGNYAITNPELSIINGILLGVKAGTTVSKLLDSFTGDVYVVDGDGKILADSEYVPTGSKIRVGTSDIVATVVVKGDVDGDGKLASQDYVLVKRTFFRTYNLEGVYLQAALVSGNSELNVRDYILLKRAYFGTYKIQ